MTPSKTYHIYNHGNANDNLFHCDENYRYFLQKYGEYITPIVHTNAYCLLPNHFHFLIQVQEEDVLTNQPGFKNLAVLNLEKRIIQQFSNFFNAYTKAFNKMYDRKGKLFLTPFYRKVVAHPWQFLNTWKLFITIRCVTSLHVIHMAGHTAPFMITGRIRIIAFLFQMREFWRNQLLVLMGREILNQTGTILLNLTIEKK